MELQKKRKQGNNKLPNSSSNKKQKLAEPAVESITSDLPSIATHGYFQFTEGAEPVLTEQQCIDLNTLYFASNKQHLQRTGLLAGHGYRYVAFHNTDAKLTPDEETFRVHAKYKALFSEIVVALANDFTKRFALENLKIGGAEFIEYINETKEEKFGQITHLDGTCTLADNRYGLFLPVRVNAKQSAISTRAPNLLSVGTRVVDLAHYGERFDPLHAPEYRNHAIWGANAQAISLKSSHTNYSAIVVNKIPHGGGKQPAYSHRVTLFLYLVPLDWTATEELDITIPAVEFLARRSEKDEEMIDLECVSDTEIAEWVYRIPDLYKHFEGEVKRAKDLYNNRLAFTRKLEKLGQLPNA